jgi:hypothetical protein
VWHLISLTSGSTRDRVRRFKPDARLFDKSSEPHIEVLQIRARLEFDTARPKENRATFL